MKKTALAVSLLAGGLVLAGCGSTGGSSSDGDSSAPTATATVTATTTTTAPASSSAPSTSGSSSPTVTKRPTVPARCTLSDLKVTLGPPEGAAGSSFYPLHLTNTSGSACRTGGFGGASLVISPRSEPVGAPADRAQQGTAKPIVLTPGKRVTATLKVVNAENFGSGRCRPTPTKGLRVYPPNETNAAYVPLDATACQSPKVHLLELRPYRAG